MAVTIESGLMRLADSIPDNAPDTTELPEAIRYAGDVINSGFCTLAKSIERIARTFEDK